MFSLYKSWDNRRQVKTERLQSQCLNGRTWTRRVQWLVGDEGSSIVKLKFWEGEYYREAGVSLAFAQRVYDRFREGQAALDALSIYGVQVTLSRKASK